jgi:Protein of unknown function (DUF2442)
MATTENITVFATDRETRQWVEGFVPARMVVSRASSRRISQCQNLFVLTRATRMESTVEAISELRERMRVLFVYADVKPEWIPETLYRSKFRALRNLIVHFSDDPVVGRVLRAWNMNSQNKLIADAAVVGDVLEVRSCGMERFEVSFSAIPTLAEIPEDKRSAFEIDHDGGRISWPEADVDLGLDSLVRATSPEARDRADQDAMLRGARLGEAICQVREDSSLTQSQIPGLSERQLRRIEHGQSRPRLSTLEVLAKAHRTSLSEYLDQVARAASALPKAKVAR